MFRQAFEYKRWADKRTVAALVDVDRNRYAEAYAFILQQLNHMIIVEELFKSRLTGSSAPHGSTNSTPLPALEELQDRLFACNDWYASYCSEVDDLLREVVFTFTDGRPGTMAVQEILFHIVTHGSYHRGSIAHALDLAAVPHPPDGYGIFIHEREPGRRNH